MDAGGLSILGVGQLHYCSVGLKIGSHSIAQPENLQVQHPRRQDRFPQGGRLPGQGAKLSRSCYFEGNGSSRNQSRWSPQEIWGDGAEEIENNEDMEKFYKPS